MAQKDITKGTCKRFNSEKGFGFINVDDGLGDVFVHYSEIKANGFRSLQEGEPLEFELVTRDDGRRKAVNVTGPNGSFVTGKAVTVNDIYKIGVNAKIHYGDGGENDMKWNIFVCDKLQQINPNIMKTLKKELIKLGEINDDWRENEPIQNIIDPDLYVYKFYHKNKWINEVKEKFKADLDEDDDYNENVNRMNEKFKKILENAEKGYFIRRKYQWLSTQFKENQYGKINICSPIHNISPRSKYENVYSGIEHIFEKMLPLFNKFASFKNRNKDNEFQVIVKSQRYLIENMSGYSGHWHQEGLTENISIVGLYYYELTHGLTGGSLRFRNLRQPSPGYAEYIDATIVHEAKIDEGTAIVFDNENLVHRVRMLKNKIDDNQSRYRSFLAFFIVDTQKTIKSTKDVPTLKKEDYIEILMKNTPINSNDIATLICDYGSCGYTLNEAKNIRKLNIEIRKKPTTKGKWGIHSFGNSGEQMWFTHGKAYPQQHYEWMSDNELNFKTTTHSEL